MEFLLDIKVAPFTGKQTSSLFQLVVKSEPELKEKACFNQHNWICDMLKIARGFVYIELTCFSSKWQGDKRLYDPRRRFC